MKLQTMKTFKIETEQFKKAHALIIQSLHDKMCHFFMISFLKIESRYDFGKKK